MRAAVMEDVQFGLVRATKQQLVSALLGMLVWTAGIRLPNPLHSI